MDNYLDIALVGIIFNSYLSYSFINRFNLINKLSSRLIKFFLLPFIIANFGLVLFVDLVNIYYLSGLLILLLIFAIYKKVVKEVLTFSVLYYLNNISIYFISYGSKSKNGVLIIDDPKGIYAYLAIPLISFCLIASLILVKKRITKAKYEYRVLVEIDQIKLKLSGYLDSGNTLMINNLPVIFLSAKYQYLLSFSQGQKVIAITTIQGEELLAHSLKGSITYKHRNKKNKFDVLISIIKSRSHFHGCDCLLNLYLST